MAGLRFRKSLRLAPGVRLSVSKSGLGISAGVKGLRYSVHSSGRRTRSVSLPGTGISHVTTSGTATREPRGGSASAGALPLDAGGFDQTKLLPKPGFFARSAERRYYDGLVAYLSNDKPKALAAFEAALEQGAEATSAHLFAALSTDDVAPLIRHLELLVATDEAFPDRFRNKFLPPGRGELSLAVRVTELISARVPFDVTGATLMLAEGYQQSGRLEEAIGVVQQLHDAIPSDVAIRLSLADLLFADKDYEGVVEVAGGVENEDDLTASLVHLRALALIALGHRTAANESFKEALSKTAKRDPVLLSSIRYDRAVAYEQAGQKAKARADYERLYAVDPDYEDVRERLADLSH